MRPLFLVGHVLSWRERYVRNYVFAFCACGWGLVLSTKMLAGKVCFYVCGHPLSFIRQGWILGYILNIPGYCLVWATKLLLAAIGLVFPVLVLGYKSFNCSMYHVPVPTLIEIFCMNIFSTAIYSRWQHHFFDIQTQGVSKVSCTNSYVLF